MAAQVEEAQQPFKPFEWLFEPAEMVEAIQDMGVVERLAKDCLDAFVVAAVVGCGTSGLSQALRDSLGCAHVFSLDSDGDAIARRGARRG